MAAYLADTQPFCLAQGTQHPVRKPLFHCLPCCHWQQPAQQRWPLVPGKGRGVYPLYLLPSQRELTAPIEHRCRLLDQGLGYQARELVKLVGRRIGERGPSIATMLDVLVHGQRDSQQTGRIGFLAGQLVLSVKQLPAPLLGVLATL